MHLLTNIVVSAIICLHLRLTKARQSQLLKTCLIMTFQYDIWHIGLDIIKYPTCSNTDSLVAIILDTTQYSPGLIKIDRLSTLRNHPKFQVGQCDKKISDLRGENLEKKLEEVIR